MVRRAGPAIVVGSLATTSRPQVKVKINTRLEAPSVLVHTNISLWRPLTALTRSHNLSKSKLSWRSLCSIALRRNHMPLVYLKGSNSCFDAFETRWSFLAGALVDINEHSELVRVGEDRQNDVQARKGLRTATRRDIIDARRNESPQSTYLDLPGHDSAIPESIQQSVGLHACNMNMEPDLC